MRGLTEKKRPFIHPEALVESLKIGENTRIWAFTHVMEGAVVGANCNIGDHCFVETGAMIGNNVTIKNGNMIWAGVVLEEGVFVGPGVRFTNDPYPRSARLREAKERYKDDRWLVRTFVRRGATLGAGAVVLAGVTIGEYSMVAAGSVVTRSVEPHALVVGNPARPRGWVCRCGQRLSFEGATGTCGACGATFDRSRHVVRLVGSTGEGRHFERRRRGADG